MNNERLSGCTLKKCLYAFTAIVLTAAIVSSVCFEVFHAGHEENCHEENCAVCLVLQIIHSAEKLFQSFHNYEGEFSYLTVLLFIVFLEAHLVHQTIVSRKIKLQI
ncbi:MAG: hypothetical protein K6B73_08155 [Treponema sp.]|nr:hypothetical protein [Treponema sp.]